MNLSLYNVLERYDDYVPYVLLLVFLTLCIVKYVSVSDTKVELRQGGKLYITNFKFRYLFIYLFGYAVYIAFSLAKKIGASGASDAYYYKYYFENYGQDLGLFMKESTFEPLYSLISHLFRLFTDNYSYMLWFWYTLTFVLLIGFIKQLYMEKYSFLVILTMLTMLITQYNTLRMSISITIALTSLFFMKNDKWIKALIVILLAMGIQVSAFIMIPVWIVNYVLTKVTGFNKEKLIFFVLIGEILTIASTSLVSRIVLHSSKAAYLGESSLAIGMYSITFVVFILCLVKYDEIVAVNPINYYLINMMPICFICIPLQYNISIFYRMVLYFMPIILGIIPSICVSYVSKETKMNVNGLAVIIITHFYILSRIVSFCLEEVPYVGRYYSAFIK